MGDLVTFDEADEVEDPLNYGFDAPQRHSPSPPVFHVEQKLDITVKPKPKSAVQTMKEAADPPFSTAASAETKIKGKKNR